MDRVTVSSIVEEAVTRSVDLVYPPGTKAQFDNKLVRHRVLVPVDDIHRRLLIMDESDVPFES